MKFFFPFVFLFVLFSCKTNKDVSPNNGEVNYDDGINPTTETEIFDSLATIEGTTLKSMTTSGVQYSYYGGSDQVSTYYSKQAYYYAYDMDKRLKKVVYEDDDWRKRRTTTFEYNDLGALNKMILNWYNPGITPSKDEILMLESDQGGSKVVAKGRYAPYFPPINPDNTSYKNLLMVNDKKQVQQLPHCFYMPDAMNAYYEIGYDAKSNVNSMNFNYVSTDGVLLHFPILNNIEYTKYVRSPFKSYTFALAHHLTNLSEDLIDVGVNMPVKFNNKSFNRSESIMSRYGYGWGLAEFGVQQNYTYYYNQKKLPTMIIREIKYEELRPAKIDTIRFSYE